MISRRTSSILSDVFVEIFTGTVRGSGGGWHTKVYKDNLYDFLYENEYPAWLCNASQKISNYSKRSIKTFIMKLHTGETQFAVTSDWNWPERKKLGQQYLRQLAEDIINYLNDNYSDINKIIELKENLISSLELDGYIFEDKLLLYSEDNILDAREESNILKKLFKKLNLNNYQIFSHHLELSEDHYLKKRWDDSISNIRKVLEIILQEIAYSHSKNIKKRDLSLSTYKSPAKVRTYLEDKKILEKKEKDALSKIYSLLSETGGHPYIAKNDQARLLRNLALTISQFSMLRYYGIYKNL